MEIPVDKNDEEGQPSIALNRRSELQTNFLLMRAAEKMLHSTRRVDNLPK